LQVFYNIEIKYKQCAFVSINLGTNVGLKNNILKMMKIVTSNKFRKICVAKLLNKRKRYFPYVLHAW
jgi:hypothetical protein